ncbi:MAG: hypothetical protein KGY38_04225, partial [Desulfobacterales bacterium]|nr:hypothetical protein [Desulfobacterales bacterium]
MKIRYRQIKFKKKYRKQAARQIFAIILLSCIVAACVNHFRSNGIPIVKDWSGQNLSDDTGDSLAISLDTASRLFARRRTLPL